METDTERIDELERRVKELEARPQPIFYYPPMFQPTYTPPNWPPINPGAVDSNAAGRPPFGSTTCIH